MQNVNQPILTGLLFIMFGLLSGLPFFGLGRVFEYPDILRQPTGEVLRKYKAGGVRLRLLWLAFASAFLALVPVVVLFHQALAAQGPAPWYLGIGTAFGLLAAGFNLLGLIRWVFLVPLLVEKYLDEEASQATRESVEVVFEALHTYAGMSIGEFLGYTCLALWGVIVGAAILETGLLNWVFGASAIVLSLGVLIGDLEFAGWKPAGAIVAISSSLLIVWSLAVGLAFLFV